MQMFIKILKNAALISRHMEAMCGLLFALTALLLYFINVLCSIFTKILYYLYYMPYPYW